jgi:hypothetical protein
VKVNIAFSLEFELVWFGTIINKQTKAHTNKQTITRPFASGFKL